MLAPDNANCPINSTKSMLTLNIFRHKIHQSDIMVMCDCVFSHFTCSAYATNIQVQYFVILHGKFDIDELLMCTGINTVYTPKMTAIVQYSFTSCIGRLENSLNAVNNDKITNIEWFLQKCLKLQIEQKHFSLATLGNFYINCHLIVMIGLSHDAIFLYSHGMRAKLMWNK